MKISVKVKTGKKKSKVIKNDFADYEVWVKSRPVKGAANKELIKVLADYFNTKKSNLRIKSGLTSPTKIIELAH
jgi:uncharacterized protein (TIGR00251 family)